MLDLCIRVLAMQALQISEEHELSGAKSELAINVYRLALRNRRTQNSTSLQEGFLENGITSIWPDSPIDDQDCHAFRLNALCIDALARQDYSHITSLARLLQSDLRTSVSSSLIFEIDVCSFHHAGANLGYETASDDLVDFVKGMHRLVRTPERHRGARAEKMFEALIGLADVHEIPLDFFWRSIRTIIGCVGSNFHLKRRIDETIDGISYDPLLSELLRSDLYCHEQRTFPWQSWPLEDMNHLVDEFKERTQWKQNTELEESLRFSLIC